MTVKHGFNNAIADDSAAALAGETLPSHWNADHTITTLQVPTAAGGNVVTIAGGTAGNPVTATASGADTNISIKLAPKGTLGFTQLGPNTHGPGLGFSAGANVEIYEAATTVTESYGIYAERYCGNLASGVVGALQFIAGTQGVGATQNLTAVSGIAGFAYNSLPAGRTVTNLLGASFQATTDGGATTTDARAVNAEVNGSAGGSIINSGYAFHATVSDLSATPGTQKAYAFAAVNDTGVTSAEYYVLRSNDASAAATTPYFLWNDSPGVYLVKGNGEAQYHNPGFATKYTPGLANFERIVLGQWNSNVAEIGTEKGGTGTVRAVRFIGSAYKFAALTSNGFVKTSGGDGTLSVDTGTYALQSYVDAAVTGLLDFKGNTDASGNPNYPVGIKGDAYYISVAGKIGGASGKSVDVGDVYVASADNAGGTEASVGTSWFVMEHNLVGAVVQGGALGTPSSGTLTNCTALPVAGITASTSTALGVGSVELGHASDTTLSRASAGVLAVEGVAVLTVAGGLLTGPITLGENTSIALDPAGSADGKYSGMTIAGTGGATIAFGDLITLDKDDSRWELVDISVAAAATGDARGLLGMAVTSSTDGTAVTVLLHGQIRADANFPSLTIGAAVFASTTGDVVVTQPTTTDHVIRIIGYGLTADEMYFCPGPTWTTHT